MTKFNGPVLFTWAALAAFFIGGFVLIPTTALAGAPATSYPTSTPMARLPFPTAAPTSTASPTSTLFPTSTPVVSRFPSLEAFTAQVQTGEKDAVVGIYVSNTLALPVSPQPEGQSGFVTRNPDQATQFGLAEKYGTVGILAHNDLAGAQFAALRSHQTAYVIYGDGHAQGYEINTAQRYQALSPSSPFSDFINMDNPQERLTAGDLFNRIYAPGKQLIFQTCIAAHGNASWGRMFIIATPLPADQPTSYAPRWKLLAHLEF